MFIPKNEGIIDVMQKNASDTYIFVAPELFDF